MKRLLHNHLTFVGCCLLLGTGLQSAQAQQRYTLATTQTTSYRGQDEKEQTSLSQALQQLETQYTIRFFYDPSLVEQHVPTRMLVGDDLEETLGKLLPPLSLQFKKIRPDYYVIKQQKLPPVPKLSAQPLGNSPFPARKQGAPSTTATLLPENVEKTITGTITDQSTGEELPGVNILVKGTSIGTVTDVTGTYRLTAPDDAETLVFSSVGYTSEEVVIGNQITINVGLTPDIQSLSEVVVVGYGEQKKVNLTGSVATVESEFLENRPITNSSQALHNLPGVNVNQSSGRPGADGANIRIRGVGTLGNANPLVIVDGIEFSLRDVNPNDIESVTVLKDAAAAAIYGNRAANGVVLITTKKGKQGDVRVNYNNYLGFQEVNQLPENVVWNTLDYMEGKNQAFANEGKAPEYPEEVLEEYRNGTDPYLYPNTNWFDVMFRQAFIQEHNLRVSGGNEKTTFSLSLGYLDQDGIVINTNAKRYSVNMNLSSQVSDRLKIGGNVIGTFWRDQESYYTTNEGNGEGGLMGLIYRGLPFQTPALADGAYADQWLRAAGHNAYRNPFAIANEGYRRRESLRTFINLFAEYTLPGEIKYKVVVAPDLSYERDKYFKPEILLTQPKTGELAPMKNVPLRGVDIERADGIALTNFHTLSWEKTLATAHNLNVLLGFSTEIRRFERSDVEKTGYLGNSTPEFDAGSDLNKIEGTSGLEKQVSYFGRLSYNFDERYLLETNFRYDGSSKFARGNRYGFFPSVSGAWRVSEESFFKDNVSFISNLKLRASYGILGNDNIPSFAFLNKVELGRNYVFNGNVVPGVAIEDLADETITWETVRMTDIGLNLGLFEERLSIEVDWFSKITNDILLRVPVPQQVGNLGAPFRNFAKVANRGYEVSVLHRNRLQDFGYTIGANVTYVKNEILTIGEDLFSGRNNSAINREGEPIDSWYGYKTDGLFRSEAEINGAAVLGGRETVPGDIRYQDLNEDGVIDGEDRAVVGTSIPPWTFGMNLRADYRNFDFSAFFQGVQGSSSYLRTNLAYPYRNGAGVTREWLTDSWTPDNPNASLPRIISPNFGLTDNNYQPSDFWVRNTSYVRLKNIQLGYTFAGLVERFPIQQLRLFVNAQNLFTFTDFTQGDPERSADDVGIIAYPIQKIITAGLNITL